MKEKSVVFGLGNEFNWAKEKIFDRFDVIGFSDNDLSKSSGIYMELFIAPDDLNKVEFDRVIICSRKYYDDIKIQLIEMGIEYEKIVGLECIDTFQDEMDYLEIVSDIDRYKACEQDELFCLRKDQLWLITSDRNTNAASPSHHYFAQDIWGARKIYMNRPEKHFDIGSRLDGFIAHLLVFMDVYYIDVRPLPFSIPHLQYVHGDATNLGSISDSSIESLSCFHALEHFGLGRYGDSIDPKGYIKAAQEMVRVLKPGGKLYIGVPVGPCNKLVFNAHRIFSIRSLISLFCDLRLNDLALISPDGYEERCINEDEYSCIKEFSCGLFEFVKP